MSAYPDSEIEGTLRRRDGCVFIDSQGHLSLVLWPEGFRAGRDGRELRILGGIEHPERRTDRPSELGGGGADLAFAQKLIGEPIPSRSRAVGGHSIASP